jgi:hypothetical protein
MISVVRKAHAFQVRARTPGLYKRWQAMGAAGLACLRALLHHARKPSNSLVLMAYWTGVLGFV